MDLFINQAKQFKENIAVIAAGKKYSYAALLDMSEIFAALLLDTEDDLQEKRVAFMVEPGFDYVTVQWAIWRAGGIAVPLCLTHPLPSLQYVIEDSGASMIVVSPQYEILLKDLAREKNIRLVSVGNTNQPSKKSLPNIAPSRRAMILYTSGTTNLPKGVVTTHQTLSAQITTLVKAWEWSSSDKIICILPLHHVHGIVNVVSCSLWSGASCLFLPEFEAEKIFDSILNGELTLFMAVPTIYFKLISYFDQQPEARKKEISLSLNKLRLMVSGSAALPVSVMEKWKNISGHDLLERYGMTEIGMAISNPYTGQRKAGYVGKPLPGVSIRLTGDNNEDVVAGEPGQILVKGENVFQEYWNKPAATHSSFTEDGWFMTGDVAVLEDGYYRIMGRNSVDIIKSGGYKISALEIEEVLRSHPAIKDCAVVGIENEEWGEIVAAALVISGNGGISFEEINQWLRQRIPAYRVPRKYIEVTDLPRNAMGKVTKNDVKKLF